MKSVSGVILLFFSIGCATSPYHSVTSDPPASPPKTRICETETYTDNPEYKEYSVKEFVNTLQGAEVVYLQTDVRKCEEMFSEESGAECGLQRVDKLVWEKDKKVIDSFYFLESGCQEPHSPSLKMEPWDQNDVRVHSDMVDVQHYWNYYSQDDEQESRCLVRRFMLDRLKMKFSELPEEDCRLQK